MLHIHANITHTSYFFTDVDKPIPQMGPREAWWNRIYKC